MNYEILKEKLDQYKIGFISLKPYRTKLDKVTNVLGNVGYNYENLVARSIEQLKSGDVVNGKNFDAIEFANAIEQKLAELISPDTNRSEGQSNAYYKLTENGALLFCIKNGSVKIRCLLVSETILEKGTPRTQSYGSRNPLTPIKDYITSQLPIGQLRTYTIANELLEQIKFNGDTFEV